MAATAAVAAVSEPDSMLQASALRLISKHAWDDRATEAHAYIQRVIWPRVRHAAEHHGLVAWIVNIDEDNKEDASHSSIAYCLQRNHFEVNLGVVDCARVTELNDPHTAASRVHHLMRTLGTDIITQINNPSVNTLDSTQCYVLLIDWSQASIGDLGSDDDVDGISNDDLYSPPHAYRMGQVATVPAPFGSIYTPVRGPALMRSCRRPLPAPVYMQQTLWGRLRAMFCIRTLTL